MRRTIFEPEHDQFRQTARTFYEKECVPHTEQWERDGQVSRQAWLRAGGELSADEPAGAKFWATETLGRGMGF